jgi:uncharacterized membrane protein YkoI
MQPKKAKAFILSAAMTVGVAGLAPTFTFAKEKDRDEQVKYNDTPRAVRDALDRERGRYEIKRIDHVDRNGQEFYRATIDTKGGEDTVVRVNPSGKILSSEQVNDPTERNAGVRRDVINDRDESTVVKYNSVPARVRDVLDRERGNRDFKIIYHVNKDGRDYYNAIVDERNGDRSVRVSADGRLLSEEDLREVRTAGARYDSGVRRDVGANNYDLPRGGERMDYDRLPGDVKTSMGHELGRDRVTDVYRYDSRGSTVYEAETSNGRIIRVDSSGRLVNPDRAYDNGDRIAYDRLPGEVKTALGREAGQDRVRDVYQYQRNGRTIYEATVAGPNGDRTIRVDDTGHLLRSAR